MDKQHKRQITRQYKETRLQGGVYAICCTKNAKRLLLSTSDIAGSENRFCFSQNIDSCVHPKLRQDWQQFGGAAFTFEIIETLTQKESQTDSDFQNEVVALLELLKTQVAPETLY